MKPIIGITTFLELKAMPNRTYASVSQHYSRAVVQAGGIPVLIPILAEGTDLSPYLACVDGLLLSGGEDVSPLLYGEDPIKEVKKFSVPRDSQEMILFQKAFDMKKPILGICRGHQLIHVALGGSLHQDVYAQVSGAIGHDPIENSVDALYHQVVIDVDTQLYKIFNTEVLGVNSLHHQAVKQVGRGMKATAHAKDGMIEGTEYMGDQFLVSVQWHPEDLTLKHPQHLELFKAFVHACGGKDENR